MTDSKRLPIRVLIADDEAEVRDAYRQILLEADMSSETAVFRNLRERLFTQSRCGSAGEEALGAAIPTFAPVFCDGAEAAVAAVRDALAADDPFAVAFLDMRMPPGPDGVWAAARIRELDPAIEIVLCTAYSDVDPRDIGAMVPPEEKLSYLQKPFHPHEIRQMTISLASKWRAEHRIVKLAYFDALTGLPNREQSRNRLASALAAAQAASAHAGGAVSGSRQFQAGQRYARAMRSATSCCAWSRRACAVRCARTRARRRMRCRARARTTSRGWAATNSS